MVTKLNAPLKRELSIDGKPYVLTVTSTGFLLTEKGRRKGLEMDWVALVSGDAALATALTASLANAPPERKPAATPAPAPIRVPKKA
jgi:hypothetical protein